MLQYPCFTLVKGPLAGDPFYVSKTLETQKNKMIFKWINIAFYTWSHQEYLDPCLDLFQVDIALVILTLVVFIHPAYVFIYCRRAANNRANKMPSNAAQDLKLASVNL